MVCWQIYLSPRAMSCMGVSEGRAWLQMTKMPCSLGYEMLRECIKITQNMKASKVAERGV